MLVPATAISHHRSSHHPNTQQDADAHSACKHISIIRSCRSRGIQQQKQSHHLRSQISQIWALIAAGLESKIRMHCRRLMLAECAPSQGLWMHEKLLHRTHGMRNLTSMPSWLTFASTVSCHRRLVLYLSLITLTLLIHSLSCPRITDEARQQSFARPAQHSSKLQTQYVSQL